jgi:ABC-type multidrug transport system ATPase subunit
MNQGQITALLGHNGAGKTTTIGMLTGMVPPTSGSAVVAGYDIRTDLPLLRQNVGVCLQHDCLFPQLTVMEHMIFFSKIKGLDATMTKEEREQELLTAIEDVALLEKRHSYSKDLSGGMKRKLSVAIAFCGNSKVVFLDEPTSGMDVSVRPPGLFAISLLIPLRDITHQ